MSDFGLIVFLIAAVLSLSWVVGIRKLAKHGGVTRQTVITSMLFSIFTIYALFADETWTLNLLWIFPLSWLIGTLSLAYPLSLLWIPGSVYASIVTLGTRKRVGDSNSSLEVKPEDIKILERYLGKKNYQKDERKLTLLQDNIDLHQWQTNMELIFSDISPDMSVEHASLLGEEKEMLLKNATPELRQVLMGLQAAIHFPLGLRNEANAWFIAAYPDVLNFFYPSPNYHIKPLEKELKRLEKVKAVVDVIMDEFLNEIEKKYEGRNQSPDIGTVLAELKVYYTSKLNKQLLLSKSLSNSAEKPTDLICSKCGAESAKDSSNYCANCGTALKRNW